MYVLKKETLFPCTYMPEKKKPMYTLKSLEKIKNQELTPLKFPWNRMYFHWRERQHEDIDILVEENSATIATLKQCGL
jgi:hypothetical protein